VAIAPTVFPVAVGITCTVRLVDKVGIQAVLAKPVDAPDFV